MRAYHRARQQKLRELVREVAVGETMEVAGAEAEEGESRLRLEGEGLGGGV
jgi:hypothetical protein